MNKDDLCALRCERKIRSLIKFPTKNDIKNQINFNNIINIKNLFDEEKEIFERLIKGDDVDALIRRYKIKSTSIPNIIAKNLKFQNRNDYEKAVRKLLSDELSVCQILRHELSNLTNAIESE